MNYDFRPSPDFVKGVKALAKRYPSLKSDLLQLRQSLEHNPEQGVDRAVSSVYLPNNLTP